MLLTVGVFLFNLLCGIVPCTQKYKAPEILPEPKSNFEYIRNLDKLRTEPKVKTTAGWVQGYRIKSTQGRVIFAFEGIPYAESTAGQNRWKAPVPKRPWKGVWKALKPGKECLQISLPRMLNVHGSEDCLTINLYTPNIPESGTFDKKYSIAVFLHGGSFTFGSGAEYRPLYLLNADIILVTLNYRLGAMGFLSTGDSAIPGNYGLQDQALALKWVHENIEFFGGNKDNVTLVGNSAGAVSAHLHMISKRSRNYFSTAYLSSGTAFQHWSVQSAERTKYLTNKLASRFGCQNKDSWKLANCLRRIDANFLIVAQTVLFDWFPFPPVGFSPVVEPEHQNAFLTVTPEEAYNTGIVADKPCIFGITKDEGHLIMMITLVFMRTLPLTLKWDQLAPLYLFYKDLVPNPKEITDKVNNFYLKGERPRHNMNLEQFSVMFSDRFFNLGVARALQSHFSSGAPAYFYLFSFSDANHNIVNSIGRRSFRGTDHDITYLLNDPDLVDGHRLNDPDAELSSIMINLLVNFAETGVPRYSSKSGEAIDIWEPILDLAELRALKLDRNVEMIPFPRKFVERVNFWHNLGLPNTSLLTPLRYSTARKQHQLDVHVHKPTKRSVAIPHQNYVIDG